MFFYMSMYSSQLSDLENNFKKYNLNFIQIPDSVPSSTSSTAATSIYLIDSIVQTSFTQYLSYKVSANDEIHSNNVIFFYIISNLQLR